MAGKAEQNLDPVHNANSATGQPQDPDHVEVLGADIIPSMYRSSRSLGPLPAARGVSRMRQPPALQRTPSGLWKCLQVACLNTNLPQNLAQFSRALLLPQA